MDPTELRSVLHAALRLWRGPALGEFACEEWAVVESARLEELRALATEDLGEAMLADGKAAQAVPLFEEHVAVHPYRERPVGLLMQALATSGRPTDALRTFQRYRLMLRDEVGAEPTADLCLLEAELLEAADRNNSPMWDAATANLPRPADGFVGRKDERTRLAADVQARSLVTLTGPGGAGKTRMAIETGWAMAAEFPDGVWLIDLAPLTDPATVLPTLAATLDVSSEQRFSLTQSVVSAMRTKQALLIVDNCEHVVDSVSSLIDALVGGCPQLRILATSQQSLDVRGEYVHVLAPLDEREGYELFCERARSIDDRFIDTDRVAIESLCRQLDGLPLAIELAAAKTRSMTSADILAHLDDRFRMLRRHRSGSRDDDRHQTLQATVAWSYQLLDDAERLLFERLSVFAGGFSLAAAEGVCGTSPIGTFEVVDILASLVDKSMVVADVGGSTVRYRLLDTLRQFGYERLRERDDLDSLRRRHFEFYLALAESFDRVGPTGTLPANELIELEWANFREAVQWGTDNGEAAPTGWMIGFIGTRIQGARDEYVTWVDAALDALPADHPVMADLYACASSEASTRGQFGEMLAFADRGLGIDPNSARLHSWRALALYNLGHADQGLVAVRQALATPHVDLEHRQTFALHTAVTCASVAEPGSLPEFAGRIREIADTSGHPYDISVAKLADGVTKFVAGDPVAAIEQFRAARHHATSIPPVEVAVLFLMARASAAANLDDTPMVIRECIELSTQLQNAVYIWRAIELLAIYWTRIGQVEDAAVLLGAVEAAGVASPVLGGERREATEVISANADLSALLRRGTDMSRAEILTFALERLDSARL